MLYATRVKEPGKIIPKFRNKISPAGITALVILMENAFFIFSESIVFLLPLHDSCIEEDIQLHEIS